LKTGRGPALLYKNRWQVELFKAVEKKWLGLQKIIHWNFV
jgi:hypothetical protein